MQTIFIINIVLIYFFQSSFILTETKQIIPDEVPLTKIIYAGRNITIYTSASNPSRDPKAWLFWYDPLVVFDSSKDIQQYNEQVRFQFSISSGEFDQLARQTIIASMHPDVTQFAVFWIIEPLPINTLSIYVVDQAFQPVSAIYPCTKTDLSGILTFECQFQCSSMVIATSIVQNILCGKLKFQFEYYIQSISYPIIIPPRIATTFNLQNLRSHFGVGKYIHRRQENKFMKKYFVNIQSIDETIKEIELKKLFHLALKTTTRYEIDHFNDIWSLEDFDKIINHELFYTSYHSNQKILFHLRSTDSPWTLKSLGKQTFYIDEIQKMILEQLHINVEWLSKEKKWKIISLKVRLVTDILDNLQLALINKQYEIDKINATYHRTIDCSDWSTTCACQSTSSALVFISNTQLIRIPNIDMDFSLTGFTIELWIRPDLLPNGIHQVQLINFRGEYRVTYQSKGEVTFSLIDKKHLHLYTTTLKAIPLHQWTYLSCVYSAVDNQLQLYVNGEFVSSIVLSIKSYKVSNDIIIGQQFIGAVRDLRLWACARTADEIHFTMQINNLFGNETCLVGLWPMADALGQIIQDLTVNNVPHPGTLGFDDNPNLLTDPIWAYVLPKPSTPKPPPPPRTLTYQIFRENLTLPMIVPWGTIYDTPVPADYDGDGFADFAVYRRLTMTWLVSSSIDPHITLSKFWGLPGDIPVQANFDGDKFFDYTVFRPRTAQWLSHLSSNPEFQYIQLWGKPGDIPCPGDFDGDGKTDFVVYRRGAWYINPSSDPSIQMTKQWGQPGDVPVAGCDFDADGRSDFTVWTPSTGIWSWIPSSSPSIYYQRQWGSRLDLPICGDFDGDKRTDFTVYRSWSGEWFIIPYSVSAFIITYRWGKPTDFPVVGDYDGDGRAEFALWRQRANMTYVWEIIPSSMPSVIIRKPWGIPGDIPLVGDFDGDKKCDFTVWRPTNGFWYSVFIARPGRQLIKHWGFTVNDTAVAADWDGDLVTDFTIYRPTTGYWYIMLSRNPILQIFMQWGVPLYKDVPVPGDYDGDGKFDFAVWRPSTGIWFILPSSNPASIVMCQWGLPDDIPLTGGDFDLDGKTDIAVWRPSNGSWYVLPSSNPVYPFFGPFFIRQPKIPLPPLTSVAAPGQEGAPAPDAGGDDEAAAPAAETPAANEADG